MFRIIEKLKLCEVVQTMMSRSDPNRSYLTDCCHTIITRWPLRSFSVIGDVYLTLLALKSSKIFLGIKSIVYLLKILS